MIFFTKHEVLCNVIEKTV